jgi:DNA-binding transcriptional regulator YiaG
MSPSKDDDRVSKSSKAASSRAPSESFFARLPFVGGPSRASEASEIVASHLSLRSGDLQRYREGCGLTLSQVAQMIGVSAKTLQQWESGAERPDTDVLGTLLSLLKAHPFIQSADSVPTTEGSLRRSRGKR